MAPRKRGTRGGALARKLKEGGEGLIRRLLQRVLPRGLQKVRHYGLLSPNCREQGSRIDWQSLVWQVAAATGRVFELACQPIVVIAPPAKLRCPACGQALALVEFAPPRLSAPSPPLALPRSQPP